VEAGKLQMNAVPFSLIVIHLIYNELRAYMPGKIGAACMTCMTGVG
jgi:hypothetical protein